MRVAFLGNTGHAFLFWAIFRLWPSGKKNKKECCKYSHYLSKNLFYLFLPMHKRGHPGKELKATESGRPHWAICPECWGGGKKTQRPRKKVRLQYQLALAAFQKTGGTGTPPVRPKGGEFPCPKCKGTGLLPADNPPPADTENCPQVAIIGGGIGGVALAVACLHRGIPYTLYERDSSFDVRLQGYGLTLQQATKAIAGLGIFSLEAGVISTRHLVHTPQGKVVGEWGRRKWLAGGGTAEAKRRNVHIARQALRGELLAQLGGNASVQWGHGLLRFEQNATAGTDLTFEVAGELKKVKADLLVGADGIRSAVRKVLLGEDAYPLRYLDCIVILGICPLAALQNADYSLLDAATVFQTANGTERIYMMPYSVDSVMWQLSFPMPEEAAKELSAGGPAALKEEACRRVAGWHNPVPQIVAATLETLVSGYPVYDREPLEPGALAKWGPVTLLGDAAHPMSPFKGQGANQALLDALALARAITNGCGPHSDWRADGIRETVLKDFESEMLERSAAKVEDSAAAAQFLHSPIVLQEMDAPRGRCANSEAD